MFSKTICRKLSGKVTLILLFSLFFSAHFINSAAQEYRVKSISLPEGLSQSSVYTIGQDKTGFVWAGTQDGLNKYDGLNFTTFYNQPFDTTSISSGYISVILNDSKGRTWIGTNNNGLNLKTVPDEKFIRFTAGDGSLPDNSIKSICEDADGNILVATVCNITMLKISGNVTSKKDISFIDLTKSKSPGKCAFEYMSTIYPAERNKVWIGTKTGLYLADYSTGETKIITEYHKNSGLASDHIGVIEKDRNGNIWVGTGAGITVISGENKIIKTVHFSVGKWMSDGVSGLSFASDGSLLITTGEGLYRIKSDDVTNISTAQPVPDKVLPEEKLLSTALLSIREDQINKGLFWIGTEINGLLKLSPVTKKFTTNHLHNEMKNAFVFSILKDNKDFIWIGTTSGLLRFDRAHNKYLKFESDSKKKESLPYDFVSSISQSPDGQLFIGSPVGLAKINNPWSDHPTFIKYTVNSIVPEAPVRHIVQHEGKMYVVLPMRIFEFDPVKKVSKEVLMVNDSSVMNYSGFALSCMSFDKSGNIWLGSSNGLLLYRKSSIPFAETKAEIYFHELNDTNSLRCQTINEITISQDGGIWICTSNGFSKVEEKNGKVSFRNYSTVDGLKNNAVYGALENPEDHNMWLSTNGGLSKFDPEKNIFTNYDLHDGIQSNEFNGGSYFRSADNEFFFGGVDGYTSFYPREIIPDVQPSKTFITSFTVAGKEMKLDPLSEKKIELKYDQNSFSIDFITLHFVNPSKNRYEYMLEGYQKEWTKSGNTHRVNFTQLPAGEYVFKVKGTNNDGLTGTQTDSLKIIIRPPFWQTIWFYAAVAGFVILVFWLMHLYRLRMKMNQLKEIEKIRKEIAADFHDELGHKLTTISWFSEILQNKLNPEEKDLRNYLAKIMDTSGSLYHTMKDLLWAMDPSRDSVNDLYLKIREFGESLFDQTGVEFSAGEPSNDLKEKNLPLAYKRHVLLIFKEAMHNSFKHSKGTKVNLNVIRENGHVTISLDDNGKGFSTEPAMMGFGLKNVEKRTKQIKGKIYIDSGIRGTHIRLEVPLQN